MKYILIIIINCLLCNIICFQNQNNLRYLNESNKIINIKNGKKEFGNVFFYLVIILIIIFGLYYIFKKCKCKNCLKSRDIYNQIIKMDFNQILV